MPLTNQKNVLFQEVRRYIKEREAQSLLDIGAGDGSLAKRIAKEVQRYLAIEQDEQHVNYLRSLGLDVKEGVFPLELDERFDMVLASHSIPEQSEEYGSFLEAAWSAVQPGGILLIVTFKGSTGGAQALEHAWGDSNEPFDAELYQELLRILESFGSVTIKRVESTFCSRALEELVELAVGAMRPTDKDEERQAFVRAEIEKDKRSDGAYALVAEHLFLSVTKPKDIHL